jgi:quercetin dioxygenase-like cupin family protein
LGISAELGGLTTEEKRMKRMKTHVVSGIAMGSLGALLGSVVTFSLMGGRDETAAAGASPDQAQAAAIGGATQTVLFETTLDDLSGRVAMIRAFERAPGTRGTPHRHPGSHTFGYVLEGTYEVQVDDGPLERLGPGETFYERPGALHAVSRNGSSTDVVRYLVFTVSDPTLPATVPE